MIDARDAAIIVSLSAGTVVLRLVELTWTRLLELGCDEAQLRRRVPLPRGTPWRRVPFETLCDLVEAGLEQTRDPHLGLKLRLELDPRLGGLLILLLYACPDLRGAIERLVRYQHLLFDAHRIDVEGDRVILTVPGPDRPALPHLRVWALADVVGSLEPLTGAPGRPLEVTLSHPAPADVAPLERVFECPIVFGAPRDTLLLDPATLSRRLRHANEVFRTALEHEAQALAAAFPRRRSWSERARGALEDELPREPTLESAAARLRVSPRTLQRRLAAEGTSVGDLLGALRRELAARYLREGREIAEVAHRLGYASPASFHRAFRAWYGTTPAAYRARGAIS